MRKSLDVLDRRLNMSLTTKVKVAKFSFLNEKSYNKTVIDFTFGRHKDLSTRKSDNSPRPLSLFRVDKSLCLPNVKSITVLLYDFSFKNENFATFTFVNNCII